MQIPIVVSHPLYNIKHISKCLEFRDARKKVYVPHGTEEK